MPNWCDNWIIISGDKKRIQTIRNIFEGIQDKSEANVFMTIIGMSPNITKEEYDNSGWYEDNINNWGTKWDVSYEDCQPEFYEDYITIRPATAWSPPVEFCKKFAKEYDVHIKMEYSEPGVDFAGTTICNPDGTIIEEDYTYHEGIYHQDAEQFWNEIETNIECTLHDEPNTTCEEFIQEYDLTFITEEEKTNLTDMFNTRKSEINEQIKNKENNIS